MVAQVLSPAYDPTGVEEKWYRTWLDRRYFEARLDSTLPPFCIVIPPPNVTGSLHMGHALNNTLQDIVARYRRMGGHNVLWLPGTDHAGIATQNVVERLLKDEGLTREELGRESFVQRVWRWKEESGSLIVHQLKRLGASCDWSRERFTMDEGFSRAVQEVFVRLYREGLIYRGDYVINWCPRCVTALSDLETEYQQVEGALYYVDYPFAAGEGSITVATTRPETILGDVAVAVHPEDERYRRLVGSQVILPPSGQPIPVIADDHVDPAFGTGALKITPAHDFNDFEVGQRHRLPRPKVMDDAARMNDLAGRYRGMDRYECRKAILKDLEWAGLLRRVEKHLHMVGHCYRCKTAVEPSLSKQWFVNVKPLAVPAVEAVQRGETRIIPRSWENTYFDWMEKIRDWCISRQIWWGHQIPAWHCRSCGEVAVDLNPPSACPVCRGGDLLRESDVLDTWFSSALWPFATMGWPEDRRELHIFYPTSVLVTGFDILFFWVARMMMMGLKFLGRVPFKEVYIHALVRDAEGQKMSKSRGNVIDPLTMMDKYGTDSFRFTLAAMAAQGRDIKLSEERIAGYRNFVNKIWNAARFTLMNLEGFTPRVHPEGYDPDAPGFSKGDLELVDRWVISRLQRAVQGTVAALETFQFNEAAGTVYQYLWHEFCDWYVEAAKPHLAPGEEPRRRQITQQLLVHGLETALKLLHPFMPFITEEIWDKLPHRGESITIEPFPSPRMEWLDPEAEEKMELIMGVVRAVRNIRGELAIPPLKEVEAILVCKDEGEMKLLKAHRAYIVNLARLSSLTVGAAPSIPKTAVGSFVMGVDLFVPLGGIVDLEEEVRRLKKERAKAEKELSKIESGLKDKGFLSRAPAEVVAREEERAAQLRAKLEKLVIWQEKVGGLLPLKGE